MYRGYLNFARWHRLHLGIHEFRCLGQEMYCLINLYKSQKLSIDKFVSMVGREAAVVTPTTCVGCREYTFIMRAYLLVNQDATILGKITQLVTDLTEANFVPVFAGG